MSELITNIFANNSLNTSWII